MNWTSEYLQLLKTGRIAESYNYKFEHVPNWLYRYRKDDPLHIENFSHDKDWFSYPCDFNDPFDTCITLSEEQFYDDLRLLMLEEDYPVERKMDDDKLKVYCRNNYQDAVVTLNRKFRSKTFYQICCYSQQLFSIPMWAHYAGNHSGFCIAYSNYSKDEAHDLFPVIYSEDSVKIRSEFFSKLQMERDVGALMPFIHKYKDWSYEREWRLLKAVFEKDIEPKNPQPIKSPSAVYLGVDCSQTLSMSLQEIANSKGIPIYKMIVDYSKIGLKIVPMEQK